MSNAASTTLTEDEVRQRISDIPAYLSGAKPDPTGTITQLLHELGVEALACIRDDAVIKATGGIGSDGVSWPPYSDKSVYSQPGVPHKKQGERPRGLLTDAQDKRWRQLFVRTYRGFVSQGMDAKEAGGHAAAYAWFVLKAEGARTILEVYGQKALDGLSRIGPLLDSLVPGAAHNVFDVLPKQGEAHVGSDLPMAEWYQHGKPRRKLWPEDSEDFPDAWLARLEPIMERGLERLLERLVQ